MKILYFTGTGNSYLVAKDLGNRINTKEISRINRNYLNRTNNISEEKLIVVSPLYYGGLPRIVLEFFQTTDFTDVKEIIVVITRGDSSGIVDKQIKSFNKDKLIGLYYITMPSNYVILYNIPKYDKSLMILDKYKKELVKIADRIQSGNHLIQRDVDIYRIMGRVFQAFFHKKLKTTDKKFIANDLCNSCEVCSKVCTNNNIEMSKGKPSWKGHCEECMACIHLCPQKAVQYGKKTIKRRRYINPEVPLKILIQND